MPWLTVQGIPGVEVRVRVNTAYGRKVIDRLLISGDEIDSTTIKGIRLGRILAGLCALSATGRRQLTRPDGTDPDAFYELVAQAYREALTTTSAPALAMAEEAGVPVGTAHRWIREARRRSFLPPARRGRVG